MSKSPRILVLGLAFAQVAHVALFPHGREAGVEPPRPSRSARAQGPVVLTPVADTYVSVPEIAATAFPTGRPNGDALTLSAGFADGGALRDTSLLRFALPTTVPDNVLVYADLSLHIVSAAEWLASPPLPSTGTMEVTMQRVDEAWDEATLASPSLPARSGPTVDADVAWGPCTEAGCGGALVDVRPLVDGLGGREDHGLALRASPAGRGEPRFGWTFAAGSRESETPPFLRLEYQFVFAFPPLDLRGSAATNCETGHVDLTLYNDGGTAYTVEVRVEATGSAPRRFAVPPIIPARGSAVYVDEAWTRDTTHYVIDPDGRLPEADRANNVVPIMILICPAPSPTPTPDGASRLFLPAALARW